MATALAVQTHKAPAEAETISLTLQQLIALADIVSQIDSYKNFEPSQLPGLIGRGRHAVASIWNNVLFPLSGPTLETEAENLSAFSGCLKLMQDAIAGHQPELLPVFIETAHDLITAMAGDQVDEIYQPEEVPA
jgi:hypothetical protein